jgi:hypothetical protein
MIDLSTLLKHYKRPEIQQAIVDAAKDKEVAVSFGLKGFGKRPDMLKYPNDIMEFAKQRATSFHCSEELWGNVLQLKPGLKREELDSIRKGWDLVLDIDCKILEYSGIAAHLLVQALKHMGIRSVSVKFSGNHGFHIAVPFEAFPKKVYGKDTKGLFPEGPRKVAAYLKEMIREHLAAMMLEKEDAAAIAKRAEKKFSEIVKGGKFDPYSFLEIDTILISSRHLYRMPYCFNEKSGLVSIPIDPEKILEFDKEAAKPENVAISGIRFLDRSKAAPEEAIKLFVNAFDLAKEREIEENREVQEKKKREFTKLETAVPELFFPPCVNNILKGLEDGKKRSMFILVNFLSNVGWSDEMIDKKLKEWNKKNREELREVTITGHMSYQKRRSKSILPPNCDNKMYYQDIRICTPDNLCKKIKNPVNYAIIKARMHQENAKKAPKKKKE